MSDRLLRMFEAISSRRSLIGEVSAKVTALLVGVFGFAGRGDAKQCNCGQAISCCCLCGSNDSGCITTCKAMHYFGWAWVCPNGPTQTCCFECFNAGTPKCGGSCSNCQAGAFCSSAGSVIGCSYSCAEL